MLVRRIVEEGGVLAIFVDDFAREPLEASENTRVVFFKVVSVEPKSEGVSSYIADSDNSMLVLVSAQNNISFNMW